MLIGEFSRATGLSRDTIRFYEKIGLIDESETSRAANNYKHYHPSLVERMNLIQHAKMLGFTLDEIRQQIREWESDRLSNADKRAIILDKIPVIERKIDELIKVREYLQYKLACLQDEVPDHRPGLSQSLPE